MTFKDYRIYAPGDDIRMIDWKVYARTDNHFIKVQEEEKNLTVHILIDKSASMDFGKPVSKFDYAAMIGVGFAILQCETTRSSNFQLLQKTLTCSSQKGDGAPCSNDSAFEWDKAKGNFKAA